MTISTGRIALLSLIIPFFISYGFALEACACGTVVSEFNFTNNLSSLQHYSIQKGGTAASWTAVTPTTFDLNPGESRLIVAFSKVDCDLPEGVYDLTLRATSEADLILKSTDLSVSSCHSIRLVQDDSFSACVNTEVIVPLTVRNDGNYAEQVNLSSSNGLLSVQSIDLAPNSSEVIDLTFAPSVIGLSSVSVEAFFEGGVSSLDININASVCSFFEAFLSHDYFSLCEDEEELINITITNQGEGKEFYFGSSTDFFIDLPDSVFVEANETVTEEVIIYSSCASGLITPMISVWSEGAETIELPFILNLRGCYQPIIVAERASDNACACEGVNYLFELFNPGVRNITYALLPSAGNVYLDDQIVNRIELPVDGSVVLKLNHSIPCSYSGLMPLSLTVTAISSCNKNSSAFVNVSVVSWADCESVKVDGPSVIPSNVSPLTVPVSISNIGLRPTSYNVVVSGSALNNLLGVSRGFVTVNPGETEVVDLVLDADELTGSYLLVRVFSLDNLASDSTIIDFGSTGFTDYDFYFFFLPMGVGVLILIILTRSKLFNKGRTIKPRGKKD